MKKIFIVLVVLVLTVCLFGCNAQKKSGIVIPEEFRGKWYASLSSLDGKATCEILSDRIVFLYFREYAELELKEVAFLNAQNNYFLGSSFFSSSLEINNGKKTVLFDLPDYYDIYDNLPDFEGFDKSKYQQKTLLKIEFFEEDCLEMSIFAMDFWFHFMLLYNKI
jgi:hypothetical protein